MINKKVDESSELTAELIKELEFVIGILENHIGTNKGTKRTRRLIARAKGSPNHGPDGTIQDE